MHAVHVVNSNTILTCDVSGFSQLVPEVFVLGITEILSIKIEHCACMQVFMNVTGPNAIKGEWG